MQPKIRFIPFLLFFVFAFAVAVPLTAAAAKLYRWVDDQGNVHYSDKIPPEQAKQGRVELDKQGIEVDRVEAAKTPEELEKERELESLRAEQQKLIEKQEAADLVLLRTFRSEDDIVMARDGKLTAIDVQIKLARNNVETEKTHLADLQQRAAEQERRGEKVSQSILDEIERLRTGLKQNYDSILRKEQQKEEIRKEFQENLERFRVLKNLRSKPIASNLNNKDSATLLDTVVLCSEPPACDALWKQAELYLRKNAVTPLQMLSKTIIMTAAPTRDDQFSITISRITRANDKFTRIFFDLQCKNSSQGDTLCESDRVKRIRDGFRPALEAKQPQQPGIPPGPGSPDTSGTPN